MSRKWVLAILIIIDILSLILLITPIISLLENGFQSILVLKIALLLIITGIINTWYVNQ